MSLHLEIISPEKVLFARDVDMAVLPGSEGDIAAMVEHTPTMITLRGGVVVLIRGGEELGRYFVRGGFADITPKRCTVLADEAVPVQEIKVDEATAHLEAFSEAWDKADKNDMVALSKLQDKIQSVRAEIEAGSTQGKY